MSVISFRLTSNCLLYSDLSVDMKKCNSSNYMYVCITGDFFKCL